LACPYNQLTALDVSNNTQLEHIICFDNHIPLTDLFAASTMLASPGIFGTQTLFPRSVHPGTELFEDQSIFNGIYTDYIVTKNDVPAPANDYTVTNGKIVFHNPGFYEVTMTNDAIISIENYPTELLLTLWFWELLSSLLQRFPLA